MRIAELPGADQHPHASDDALEDAVVAVGAIRPHLVDAWEATAVAESLGYTAARVRRELGFPDTRAFGEFIFERLADRPIGAATRSANPVAMPGAAAAARAWTFTSLAYAVLWVTALVIERQASSPLAAAPIPSLAMIAGLIVTGGFALAMHRRGHFYRALQQPALAAASCGYLWRIGALATMAVTVASLPLAWVFGVRWPQLVLWVDAFVIVSTATLGLGVIMGRGVPWPARRANRLKPATVPLPRMTVVLWSSMTAVVMMTAAFGLIFSERLIMVAAGTPDANRLVLVDAVAVSLLLSLGLLERVAAAFAHRMSTANWDPHTPGGKAVRLKAGRAYQAGLMRTAAIYTGIFGAVVATGIALGILDVSRGPAPLMVAFAGGLLLILALVTVRLLDLLRSTRPALISLAAGLVIAIAAALAAAPAGLPAGSAIGLGGVTALIVATVAVRRAWQRLEGALFLA